MEIAHHFVTSWQENVSPFIDFHLRLSTNKKRARRIQCLVNDILQFFYLIATPEKKKKKEKNIFESNFCNFIRARTTLKRKYSISNNP